MSLRLSHILRNKSPRQVVTLCYIILDPRLDPLLSPALLPEFTSFALPIAFIYTRLVVAWLARLFRAKTVEWTQGTNCPPPKAKKLTSRRAHLDLRLRAMSMRLPYILGAFPPICSFHIYFSPPSSRHISASFALNKTAHSTQTPWRLQTMTWRKSIPERTISGLIDPRWSL